MGKNGKKIEPTEQKAGAARETAKDVLPVRSGNYMLRLLISNCNRLPSSPAVDVKVCRSGSENPSPGYYFVCCHPSPSSHSQHSIPNQRMRIPCACAKVSSSGTPPTC
ncbi:hypothetical protein CDAR_18651 [Caerostris darwini]|uniref:Uncharacterized protein n=1 Tax=Caerostris darwini TaxID=1538125 RepID=A0AAV4RMJ1_9ARAC|nr:hypothetical protein CDAR_18651 [Caerostris darwini]